MKYEQVENSLSEEAQTDFLNLEIEELEAIIAPGNTWSV